MWKRVLTSDGARPARTRGWTPPAAREFGGSVQVIGEVSLSAEDPQRVEAGTVLSDHAAG